MKKLLDKLSLLYPELNFVQGKQFYWSPQEKQIYYKYDPRPMYRWKLLHEVGHALLNHKSYQSDFELLQLEVAAWDKARDLSEAHDIAIDEDYIQLCLDTYRDWLHKRSTCPSCGSRSLQQSPSEYSCFNCQTSWRVSASRFCRTYRQVKRSSDNKKSPAVRQAIFS